MPARPPEPVRVVLAGRVLGIVLRAAEGDGPPDVRVRRKLMEALKVNGFTVTVRNGERLG